MTKSSCANLNRLSDISNPSIRDKLKNRMKNISVISAPSNLGLKPQTGGKLSGVTKLPETLLNNGLLEKLNAVFQTEIAVPPYNRQKDEQTSILNPQGIREFSLRLADEVGRAVRQNSFPLVLGGDCSILLGNVLAIKRLGRYGLFFLDGHADFYLPAQSQSGTVAGMDLAFATGRGDDVLSNIDGEKPLVRDEDVIVFGFRDMEEAVRDKMPKLSETEMITYSLPRIREIGAKKAALDALQKLQNDSLDGFWIHVDADVLDDRVMPAVDSRQPDGLSYEEFVKVLKILLASDKAVGMHIGIFDPEMDPDGSIAKNFTAAIVESFINLSPNRFDKTNSV